MSFLWMRNAMGSAALAVCLMTATAQAQMGSMGGGMGGQNSGSPGAGPGNPMSQQGQQPLGILGQQDNMNTMMEQGFLQDISKSSQVETDISRLALTNSGSKSIQKLAQSVIDGHQKLAGEVSDAASHRNLSLHNSVSGRVRKDEKKMQALSGTQFDQAYLKQLDHFVKNDEKSVSRVLASTDAPDLRQLAMGMQNQTQNYTQQITDAAKAESISLK